MIRSVLMAAALAAAALFVRAAEAAQCGPRTEVLASLAKDYKETPAALGISASGLLLELVIRADGRSWTILSTSPAGVSCVIDAGGNWIMKEYVRLGPAA